MYKHVVWNLWWIIKSQTLQYMGGKHDNKEWDVKWVCSLEFWNIWKMSDIKEVDVTKFKVYRWPIRLLWVLAHIKWVPLYNDFTCYCHMLVNNPGTIPMPRHFSNIVGDKQVWQNLIQKLSKIPLATFLLGGAFTYSHMSLKVLIFQHESVDPTYDPSGTIKPSMSRLSQVRMLSLFVKSLIQKRLFLLACHHSRSSPTPLVSWGLFFTLIVPWQVLY